MTKITEIIPDNLPPWLDEAIYAGQLVNTVLKRETMHKYNQIILFSIGLGYGVLVSFVILRFS